MESGPVKVSERGVAMQYNLLTLQLLTEGYTIENFPDFVQIDSSRFGGNNPLRNLGGGFVYKKDYLEQMVFATPCGLLVKGDRTINNMSYMGVDWQAENNNPVINCPYRSGDFQCAKQHFLLQEHDVQSGNAVLQFCACQKVEATFDYEKSLDKVNDLLREERERKYQAFVEARKGRVCRNHAVYDERSRSWRLSYDPERCVHLCTSHFCPILGRELQKKKANVYYDLYKSGVYEKGFICHEWQTVEKGIRYFDKKVSVDICEAFVKLCANVIKNRYRWNHSQEFMVDASLKVEVRNIRVEARPSRDLEQDLLDLQEGRYISWAPDDEKKKASEKKERRKKSRELRIRRLEEKVRRLGYENLSSGDQMRADKLLSAGRLGELEAERVEDLQKPRLIQMSLLD